METIIKTLNEIINPYNNEEFDASYYIKDVIIENKKVELRIIYPGLDTEKNNIIKREITKKVKIDLGYDGVKIIESKNNLGDKTKLIAILSGKGGVGKSNAVVNLAQAMTRRGKKVGIIDCDIYGYSIPKILNIYDTPTIENNFIKPLVTSEGIEVMSTQYFIENNENKAVVWRGPVLRQVMDNFFLSTDFSKDLDYLFIDMPPGTGDIMLNLKDYVNELDSILVTTPSLDASHVAVRCGQLAQKLEFGFLGVIENMSYYEHKGEKLHIFGKDGYDEIAKELMIPLLGEVPITKDVDAVYDKMVNDIDEKYKWDVESILDEVKIEKIKASIDSDIASLLKYKGKIDQTNIEEVIEIENNISRQVELIYIYYSHQLDQDHGNTLIQGKLLQISNYYQNIAATLSFLTPELTNLDLDNIKIAEKYSKYISDLKKVKQHVLSKEAETIMAYAGDLTNSSYDIYSTLTNAEIKFEDINNFDNEVLKLNEANYSTYIYSYDRKLRENAFNSLMSGYKNLNLTISTILINHLKSDAFKYKSRGFNSSKQMYLYNNHITPKVFDNLIKDVNKSLKYNHEYLELRKQILEVEEIHLYDMYVPIINNIDGVYEYENACEMIKEAFAPLGEEYISSVNEMITNKSIDVYPNEGKRTGAYSGGSYDSKSYVLLNYTNTLNDVFTLAHEVGHSMHSNFAKTQEYMYANYKIFVAEIASTVNELLLLNNLLAKTSDKNIRKYLLSYNLDQYRTTVFRQIMFAEFEDKIHSILQNNEELQADVFNEEYFKINQKYFGDNVHIDEMIKYEWSRIPHFYYHFYVYQYATSFLVASMIVDDIINDSNNMVEKYKNFLKSGDSLEPLDAIRELGIDLEQDDVFLKALEKYKQIIEQLRSECGN